MGDDRGDARPFRRRRLGRLHLAAGVHQCVVMGRERRLRILPRHAGCERCAQAMAQAAGLPGLEDRVMARLAELQDLGARRQGLRQWRTRPDAGHVFDQRHRSVPIPRKRGEHTLIMQLMHQGSAIIQKCEETCSGDDIFMFDRHRRPLTIHRMDKAPLDIRQLEAFAAVMSAGSITGAARLLDRSQPAVTRQIRELEAEIGYELLHRSGPRISPTLRGVQFHAQVERLLFGLRHIRERAEAIGAAALPAFEIACTSALAAGLVPDALAAVEPALLPEQVHIQSLSAEGVVQQVLSHAADFGIASLPVEHPGLDVHWIAQAPCLAALAPDDPLAGEEIVPLRALAQRRVITMANPYRLRRRVDDAFAAIGTRPSRLIDTNSSLTALALVRRGLGAAIVEPVMACALGLPGVVLRPLDVEIPFLFGAVSPVAHPLPPGIRALNEALLKVAAGLIPGFRLLDMAGTELLSRLVYGPGDHEDALR